MKIAPDQRVHLEAKRLELIENSSKMIRFEIEGSPQSYEVDLNMTGKVEINADYNGKHKVLIRPMSTTIMKEIIISSSYILFNKTSHPMQFGIGDQVLRIKPNQKKSVKIGTDINRHQLKLNFDHLKNIKENFTFEFSDIKGGYEHYIKQQNRNFHCVLHNDTEFENVIIACPVYYIKNLLPIDIFLEFIVNRDEEKAPIG